MQPKLPFLKTKADPTLRIIVQLAFYLIYRKYVKGVCTLKFMNTWTKFLQNDNAAFAKIIVHNTVFS